MRRRRSVCLFLKCAPEGGLSTLEIFQNTSGYQESLRQFDQGEASWLPLPVWESQPKSTFSFPHWEWRTGKKRLKMRDLGSKPKLRDIVRSYHFSFLWALCMIPLQPEYFLDVRFICRWEYCLAVGYIPKAGTVWSCWVTFLTSTTSKIGPAHCWGFQNKKSQDTNKPPSQRPPNKLKSNPRLKVLPSFSYSQSPVQNLSCTSCKCSLLPITSPTTKKPVYSVHKMRPRNLLLRIQA